MRSMLLLCLLLPALPSMATSPSGEVAGAAATVATVKPETVVAKRGDAVLTVSDIDAKMGTMPPDMRGGFLLEPERMSRLIDTMLLTKQLAADARRDDLHKDPQFIEELRLVETEMLSRMFVEREMKRAGVSKFDALAHEKYLANPELYTPEPEIDVRHILIRTDGRDEAEAQAMAEEALARVKAGEDFAALVVEYSGGETSPDAGLLRNVDVARLDKGFVTALADLKNAGDVTGPVRSRYGFHVVRLERFSKLPVQPFDAVKARIVDGLRAETLQAEKARFLQKYSQLPVELNDASIPALQSRYASPDLPVAGTN